MIQYKLQISDVLGFTAEVIGSGLSSALLAGTEKAINRIRETDDVLRKSK